MKRVLALALGAQLFVAAPATAQLDGVGFAQIVTYSRNLYLGTDLAPIFAAQDAQGFLDAAQNALGEVAANNFIVRAQALADEIAVFRPQVIGLQEVFNFTVDLGTGPSNGVPPFRDHLKDLQAALQAKGLFYKAVSFNTNLQVSVPNVVVPGLGAVTVGVTDRDVILVRGGIPAVPVTFPCIAPSNDGCNFSINLPLDFPDPLPDSFVFRGFCGVDATIDGQLIRFVNTHLEVQSVGGMDISAVQQAQAQELLAVIDAGTPITMPVVLLGDFNSGPTDALPAPYQQITSALYQDLHDINIINFINPLGLTCCQAPDLKNPFSFFTERIDAIFVKNTFGIFPFSLVGTTFEIVVGEFPLNLAQPNWSSDHGGPAALILGLPVLGG